MRFRVHDHLDTCVSECARRYGSVNVWRYCTEIFDYLSLSAIIDDKARPRLFGSVFGFVTCIL